MQSRGKAGKDGERSSMRPWGSRSWETASDVRRSERGLRRGLAAETGRVE